MRQCGKLTCAACICTPGWCAAGLDDLQHCRRSLKEPSTIGNLSSSLPAGVLRRSTHAHICVYQRRRGLITIDIGVCTSHADVNRSHGPAVRVAFPAANTPSAVMESRAALIRGLYREAWRRHDSVLLTATRGSKSSASTPAHQHSQSTSCRHSFGWSSTTCHVQRHCPDSASCSYRPQVSEWPAHPGKPKYSVPLMNAFGCLQSCSD